MDNFTTKDKQIFEDMKRCLQGMGLKVLEEKKEQGKLSGISAYEGEASIMAVICSYDPANHVAEVFLRYADLPVDKLPVLYELLNQINGNLVFNHYCIDPRTRALVLRSGIVVAGDILDKEMFKMVVTRNLGQGYTFIPLIMEVLSLDRTAQSIMDEFYATNDKVSERVNLNRG